MRQDIRQFIEASTLLFIASRNREGELDVSPRGGQPSVVRLDSADRLLLPDYIGNNRLDTIGNVLANPEFTLVMLNRGASRYLRIRGRAEVSTAPEHLLAFPADDNPALSLLVLTPHQTDFVETRVFDRAQFWLDPHRRRPPLDLGTAITLDRQAQAAAGFGPVLKKASEEALLVESGVRAIYGNPGQAVQTKVSDYVGPSVSSFLREAGFVVLAHCGAGGEIGLDLVGEGPLEVIPFDNRHACRLPLPADLSLPNEGELAMVCVIPGQSEVLRMNGRYERGAQVAKILPREVFFHCPAAFSRSRVWQKDQRSWWAGKRRFLCIERHQESPDVVSFVLKPCDTAPVGEILPGQYVTISLPDDPEAPRQRCYSVSRRGNGTDIRISVRRIGKGGLSDLLHDSLHPGDKVLVGTPGGRFTLRSAADRPVALISVGVGITPLMPMLEDLAAEGRSRPVWFIHGARDTTYHLFAAEAQALAKRAPWVQLISFHSRSDDPAGCDVLGRIDASAIAARLSVAGTDFYICGPETFMTGLRDDLLALGADPAAIRFEAFETGAGGGLDLSAGSIPASAKVTFARSGKSGTWTPADGSLLDFALKHEVSVPYSCRIGDCQSCLQRVLEGLASYPTGEEPLLTYDQLLLCQAVPQSDLVLDC